MAILERRGKKADRFGSPPLYDPQTAKCSVKSEISNRLCQEFWNHCPAKLRTVKPSAIAILFVTGLCLTGCSPSGAFVGAAGSGDLVLFVTQCITNRGGRASSGGFIAVQAQWTHQVSLNEDIILTTGNHFSELETFLKQVYGAPDFARGGSYQLRTYSPQQIGVSRVLYARFGFTRPIALRMPCSRAYGLGGQPGM